MVASLRGRQCTARPATGACRVHSGDDDRVPPRARERLMRFESRITPAIAERWRREGFWKPETFYEILARRAAEHPDRDVIVDRGRRVTYRQLRESVDRVAAGF